MLFDFRHLIYLASYWQTLLIYKFELCELSLFIHCTELTCGTLLFGCSNIKPDSTLLVLKKIQDNLTVTNCGVHWFWWNLCASLSAAETMCSILQGSGLGPLPFFFFRVQMLQNTVWTPPGLTGWWLTCLCVCAMLSVGLGVRWPAHPPSVQHSASQVQEAVGPGEDTAHPLYRKPLHQGELWLPEDPCWRRSHSPRRLWWEPELPGAEGGDSGPV